MSTGQEVPGPPTPTMMPKRRAAIPQAPPRAAPRATFKVATAIPRCGWAQAVVWPDSGVLLGLGTNSDLPSRFREHFANRVRVAGGVVREISRHSMRKPGPDSSEADLARIKAASFVYNQLLRADVTLPVVQLHEEDLENVAKVTEQLKALDGEGRKKGHGGEAEIIVLATKAAKQDGRKHILLTNDGGASVVAENLGILSRHIGHTLAEFACSDSSLQASSCFTWFNASLPISSPPVNSRQTSEPEFTCHALLEGCSLCDHLAIQQA